MPAKAQEIEQALSGAQLALREERLNDAERFCRDAIALAPDHSESHNALGVILRRGKRLKEAEAAYRQALKLNPRNARAQHNLGDVLRFLGKIDEAAEACRIALAIDPNLTVAYRTLADCYQRGGRADLAATTLRQLLAVAPNDVDANYDLALIEHQRQNLPAAIEGYARALDLNPTSLEAMVNIAAAYRDAGQINRSLDVIQKALAIDPNFLPARHGLGETIEKLVPPWHIPMMNESKRNNAYRDAIRAVVRPEDHVLEIGTGAGLLAMMAAEAGAKHVTTCEMVPIVAQAATDIIEKNGFATKISVIAKKSTDLVVGLDLPAAADVLVSEILANDFVGEGVVPSFNDAKARLLKPGARIIPARGHIMGALVGGPHIEYLLGLGDVCGYDMRSFAKFKPLRQFVFDLGEYSELSSDVALVSLDFQEMPGFAPIDATVSIEATAAGRCQGILQWLRLELCEGVTYDNHPRTTKSIWKPTLFSFAEPVDVAPGDRVAVRIWQSRSYILVARA